MRYRRRIRAATTINTLVSNVDFAPTLLALCGVSPRKGMQGENLTGVLTQGRGPARVIYCEGGIYQPQPWRMAVRGNYKLVTDAALSPTQLYDLAADPYEFDNRVAARSERRNRDELQSLLRQWAVRTG
jgi:arylsulfatase A-like enzyme